MTSNASGTVFFFFFCDFRSFLSHFSVMKIALIFFVSPVTAHVDSTFLAMSYSAIWLIESRDNVTSANI